MGQFLSNMTPRRAILTVLSSIALIVGLVIITTSWTHLDARQIMVIQKPVSGSLEVVVDPGDYFTWFGTVTKYPRRDQYSFSSAKDQGLMIDQSIKTGFNDGGTGHVSGVMSWEMPLKTDQVIRLHKEYGSFIAIDQQLIRPMLEKVIFSAGATMSSIESSSERRSEIPQTIDDQLQNGPYLTRVAIQNVKDPMTGQDKSVKIVQIATDEDGKLMRASKSTIKEYGITLSPVTINAITYEDSVQKQIDERQRSTQAVQLSIAAAVRATQDAITTAKQGEATAATAKWAQEAINAKEIALAEKNRQVAKLEADAAEQTKRKDILLGEGESTRKKLVMAADGGLTPKLDAYVKVQKFWADAFKGHTGAMVPTVQMGGNGANGTGINSTQQMMEMLSIKAAKDLGLEMQTSGAAATAGRTAGRK